MTNIGRIAASLGIASLAAGCVQPVYQVPGPIPLQSYPPPVSYQSLPYYRDPAPIPLQSAPQLEPLPPPAVAPSTTSAPPEDLGGSIPLQDMPAPAASASPPSSPATASGDANPDGAAPAPQPVRKVPTAGAGGSVPLEGFRPMHSQTRPAP